MLDLAFIRENADLVKSAARNKGENVDIDALLALDAERREALAAFEQLRAEQNRVSREIGQRKREKQPADDLLDRMKTVAQQVKDREAAAKDIEEKLREFLIRVPNVPADDVPVAARRRTTPSSAPGASRSSTTSKPGRTGTSPRTSTS